MQPNTVDEAFLTVTLLVLRLSQDLQRDIEKHSTGVASVLNLCEVLLHDCDACATDAECDSIQQATRSLDRRWRSICALSMERRLKYDGRSGMKPTKSS